MNEIPKGGKFVPHYLQPCLQCKEQLGYTTIEICDKCADECFCIYGCGKKAISRRKGCKECENSREKFMKTIKKWLIDNKFVHKDSKC